MAISTVVHFLHLMKWKTNLKSEKRFSQITQNVEKVQKSLSCIQLKTMDGF